MKTGKRRIPRSLIIIPLLVMLAWSIGFAMYLNFSAQITIPEKVHKTDAIIVLTGGSQRINEGLDLLNDFKADLLLISGVDKRVTAEQLVEMWGGDESVLCCIDIDYEALNTAQNAKGAYEWVRAQDVHSVRLVTSTYHMPRAWLEFRYAMPDIDITLHPVKPAAGDNLTEADLWFIAFREYNKTLMSWARLRLS